MIEDDEDKLDTVFPLPLWFVLLVGLFFFYGCASSDDLRVCLMKVMGQTEDGMAVVAQQCMAPEAFQETQK